MEEHIYGALIAAGFAVIGWFISRIFSEIERSRQNERTLFEKVNEVEKNQLKQHIDILKDALGQARKS